MKIVLIGYGKMGQAIEKIAIAKGHTVVGVFDESNAHELANITDGTADVAIEFTRPEVAFTNIVTCLRKQIPIISGTTGWLQHWDEVKDICKQENGTFLYASNFSLGVNLFFKLNAMLANLMKNHPEYAIAIDEIHHTQKLDAPSGTAITLAEGVINENPAFKGWEKGEISANDKIGITSQRIDQVPGTHTISYNSEVDSIEIKHTAHSRQGFAQGALSVAEWICDKKGFLTMDDFLQIEI